MLANYHTHTYLCKHAEGTAREYIETAISSGLKTLGFSDHVPYPFPADYNSFIRMDVAQTPEYIKMISDLREEYKDKIKIYIGYEAEYYPAYFKAMLENICQYECDYIILGQHYLNNEIDGAGSGMLTDDKAHLTNYVNQVIEGISTGRFSYIAHPDMVRYRGDDDFYKKEMTRLCECALDLSVPLEINMNGLYDGRDYPYVQFWEIAKHVGNGVVIGCDAHRPQMLEKSIHKLGEDYAASLGIHLQEDITLRAVTPLN